MGNRGSSPVPATSVGHSEVVDVHTAHYKELYADLTTPGSNGEPVDGKTFRVSMFPACMHGLVLVPCLTFPYASQNLLSQLGSVCKLLWWALS